MSLIDLTIEIQQKKWEKILANEKMTALGHLGTHFNGMNITFDLENSCKRTGIVLDVFNVSGQDIGDISSTDIKTGNFVLFYTGFLDNRTEYGSKRHFMEHPQLSLSLIRYLLNKQISIIGIDAPVIRRGEEHTPTDKLCADNKVFVVENNANLKSLI